jgi:hypothetical protein
VKRLKLFPRKQFYENKNDAAQRQKHCCFMSKYHVANACYMLSRDDIVVSTAVVLVTGPGLEGCPADGISTRCTE